MTLFPVFTGTRTVGGMLRQNSLLRLSSVHTCNQIPREGKALDNLVRVATDDFSKNKDYNGGSGLFLSVLENLEKRE